MFKELSDDDLVCRYIKDRSESVFRSLVDRHHDRLYSRFLSELKNPADATDLEQQLWLQVFRNMPNYKSEGKFAHYLSRIAGNLLNDFWRSKSRRADLFIENRRSGSDNQSVDEQPESKEPETQIPDQADSVDNENLVRYLVTVLVPQLPVEQRTAWLLRHESEFWEPEQRLDWHHLAELNGVDKDVIWAWFEGARYKLMVNQTSTTDASANALQEEETLVFMVWSQAQRLRKGQQFTWDYLSELLDVPANTMKTRYRAAQKFLSDGLTARLNN